MELNVTLAALSLLILVCLVTSKVSSFLNLPCLLLFLIVGMLAGSEGIGRIHFEHAGIANFLGSAAMAFILFSGGYDTEWKTVKSVFRTGGILSSLGVLATAFLTGGFTWLVFRYFTGEALPFSWCFLLGSIVSSTDAAAVFSILRSRSVSLKGRLQALLEFESGSNDPMAAFLTIFMVGIVSREMSDGSPMHLLGYGIILPLFFVKMSLGILFGWLIGRAAVYVFNRINFEYDGLYYVLAIVMVLFSFSVTELAYGNGFMAVYVTGMVMGNRRFVYHNRIGRFYDGMAWMAQVVLFTMLGLLAFPSRVWEAKWLGLAVSAFLMFVARPLATFAGMFRSPFTFRERFFVSWVGLRGGAPIMLATFPLMAGIPHADRLFHIVFFIVLTSVLFQGMTIMPLAKRLKLDAPLRKEPRIPLSIEETGNTNALSREFRVTAPLDKMTLSELDLPSNALILMIRRQEEIIVPRGDTHLKTGDILTVMGDQKSVGAYAEIFSEK